MISNTTLTQTLVALEAAREEHAEDVDAVARGKQWLAHAEARCSALQADESVSVGSHAELLASRMKRGDTGPVPSLVTPDADVAARLNAQANVEAARKMLAILEADEMASRAKLTAAQKQHEAARAARMCEHLIGVAAEISERIDRVNELRAILIRYKRTYGDGTTNLPPQALAALDVVLMHNDDLAGGGTRVFNINTPLTGRVDLNMKADADLAQMWAVIDAEAAQPAHDQEQAA